ncbi:uncharacterized protein LOC144927298 [Branchiostoma floridae x Branchiostoma belcheri]
MSVFMIYAWIYTFLDTCTIPAEETTPIETITETTAAASVNNSGQASPDNTVIIASASACVAAAIIVAGIVGFILWKRRKRPSTSLYNNTYDATASSNIQLTDTSTTYRTDGNCNPTVPANIADLYAKPNKMKSTPNVDKLYANPTMKRTDYENVDQMYMYAKPNNEINVSDNQNEQAIEEEGTVDNMLYESAGNITTATSKEEGCVVNALYGRV